MDADGAPDGRIARAPDIIAVPVGDELLLHDIATDRYVRLNPSGAAVWDGLERPRTEAEVATELATRYGIDPDRAAADARRALADLIERGMARRAGAVT